MHAPTTLPCPLVLVLVLVGTQPPPLVTFPRPHNLPPPLPCAPRCPPCGPPPCLLPQMMPRAGTNCAPILLEVEQLLTFGHALRPEWTDALRSAWRSSAQVRL